MFVGPFPPWTSEPLLKPPSDIAPTRGIDPAAPAAASSTGCSSWASSTWPPWRPRAGPAHPAATIPSMRRGWVRAGEATVFEFLRSGYLSEIDSCFVAELFCAVPNPNFFRGPTRGQPLGPVGCHRPLLLVLAALAAESVASTVLCAFEAVRINQVPGPPPPPSRGTGRNKREDTGRSTWLGPRF